MSNGADSIDGRELLFHDVPVVTLPSKSRKILRGVPGRVDSANGSVVEAYWSNDPEKSAPPAGIDSSTVPDAGACST